MNAHNSAKYILDALNSLRRQTYTNWEAIVWDNASTDNCQSVVEALADSRVRYVAYPEKVSLCEARYFASDLARGELIAFLDCDDLWEPEKLAVQVPAFSNLDVAASATDYVVFVDPGSQNRRPWPDRTIKTYANTVEIGAVAGNYRVGMSTLMVRRRLLEAFRPNPIPGYMVVEDIDLVLRVLQGGRLVPIHQVLARYRWHTANTMRDMSLVESERRQWIEDFRSWCPSNVDYELVRATYLADLQQSEVRHALIRGDRVTALRQVRQMNWGLTKVKFLVALIAPSSYLRWRLV